MSRKIIIKYVYRYSLCDIQENSYFEKKWGCFFISKEESFYVINVTWQTNKKIRSSENSRS